jgi:hypothetical protein
MTFLLVHNITTTRQQPPPLRNDKYNRDHRGYSSSDASSLSLSHHHFTVAVIRSEVEEVPKAHETAESADDSTVNLLGLEVAVSNVPGHRQNNG